MAIRHAPLAATGLDAVNGDIIEADDYNTDHVLTDTDGNEVTYLSVVTPQMFGATGDGVTNDGAAFVAAIAHLKAIAVNGTGFNKGSAKLYVPPGHYYLGTTTLDITHSLIIEGAQGYSPGPATKLRWAANTTGIRLQYYITSGAADIVAAGYNSAGGTQLLNLYLLGAYTNMASEGEYHGVHSKVSFFMDGCWIQGFQGDGCRIIASAGVGAPEEGNANNSSVTRCRLYSNRNGLYVKGSDTNACYFERLDVSDNRQWGIIDRSFLLNTHIGHHAANNGLGTNITPTIVSHTGNRYVVKAGQEIAASTNAPSGTIAHNAYWIYVSAGGADAAQSISAWVSGILVREGGCYRSDNANAAHTWIGCYLEQGAPAQLVSPNLIIGAALSNVGDAARIRSFSGAVLVDKLLVDGTSALNGTVTVGPPTDGDGYTNIISDNTAGLSYFPFKTNGTEIGHILSNSSFGIILETAAGKNFYVNNNNVTIGTFDATGLDLASGKVLKVNATQVISAQGAAVADPAAITSAAGANAVAAPTKAEFDALVAEFNKVRTDLASVRTSLLANNARLRSGTGHGLYT